MAEDGLTVGDSSRDTMFSYYSRLFWIASYSPHSAKLIKLIDRIGIFRHRPDLLNPYHLNALLNPSWALDRLKEKYSRGKKEKPV